MFLAGIGWINATSTLNVLAQQLSPDEFKGRFLAVNVTIFQGSIALSSIGWGYLSEIYTTIPVMKAAAIIMAIFSAVLLLLPTEEAEKTEENAIACGDPLLQFHLK